MKSAAFAPHPVVSLKSSPLRIPRTTLIKKKCSVVEKESQLKLSCHILLSKLKQGQAKQDQLRYHLTRAIHINQRLQGRLLLVDHELHY
jgi:hypothetical protein